MRKLREAETHRLIGGDICLDFANTLNGHTRLRGHEYLLDYRDLALLSGHARLLSQRETHVMLQRAAANPVSARSAYRNALVLREVIFRVFHAVALGSKPSLDDLNRLNAAWREAQRHARLVDIGSGFALDWDDNPILERIPRSMCISAIQLLTSEKSARVRACAGEGCDWLFLDSSRNHLRRWCSMDECGNRAKMRRRQSRKKLAEASSSSS